eukprot:jgi/Mesvir1/18726/Mv01239-RA.1
MEQMRVVRPVVETGYENIVLVLLLLEARLREVVDRIPAGGERYPTPEDILEDWEDIRELAMERMEYDKDFLVELFGSVRDEWIQTDLAGWIGANRLYPGVADALRFMSSPVYIVTTKQARFALAILREMAGINFPEDKIFGLGTGPKTEILKMLQAKPEHQGAAFHFVEDRVQTLFNVIKVKELDIWRLYLGNWGYNTPEERKQAEDTPRIEVIDLPVFCAKLV